MTQLFDRLTLDAKKRTSEGYLAVRAKAARTGVYDYLASEVNAPTDRFKPTDTVKVYRDEAEVFATDAVRSFLGRPVTNDHPSVAVTADNWRQHARGDVKGALRDGQFLAFDLVLMDAETISDVDAGKRELSAGYACTLDWTAGTAPDGTAYDARQTQIRGNHVAIVDRGRAGSDCAIADRKFADCTSQFAAFDAAFFDQEKPMPKKITLDGMPVDLSDEQAVEAAISKLQGVISTRDARIVELQDSEKDLQGKNAALQTQLDEAKAASDPEALDKRIADRTALVDAAKKALPDADFKSMSDADVRKAVVEKRLGDTAKAMDDKQIAGAFAALTADGANPADKSNVTPIGKAASYSDGGTARNLVRDSRYAG